MVRLAQYGPYIARRMFGGVRGIINYLRYPNCRKKRPIVIGYHGVSDAGSTEWGPQNYDIEASEFEKQISKFDKICNIVSLTEIVDWILGEGKIPKNSVALTFDDGYQNFIDYALPILEKYSAPATVYVSTSLINSEPNVQFEHRLFAAISSAQTISVESPYISINTEVDNIKSMRKAYNYLSTQYKQLCENKREKLIGKLGEGNIESGHLLTSNDIKQLGKHPLLSVGSHSHEHIAHSGLSKERQMLNIQKSQEELEQLLGKSVEHFSYPYGSFDNKMLNIIGDSDFRSAVISTGMTISPRHWNRSYRIPRIDGAVSSKII